MTMTTSGDNVENGVVVEGSSLPPSTSTTAPGDPEIEIEVDGEITDVLTKKENGRFKKLRKRAKPPNDTNTACCNTGLSGLSSTADWEELQDLLVKKEEELAVSPAVLWRQGKLKERVEGTDHRDILHTLLLPTAATDAAAESVTEGEGAPVPGKKRKRNDNTTVETTATTTATTIPGWATLHNSVAVEHAAVLEVHTVSGDAQLLESIGQRLSACIHSIQEGVGEDGDGEQLKPKQFSVVQANTRWFQGAHPKSISGNLMYVSPTKPAKRSKSGKDGDPEIATTKDLAESLELLLMSETEWGKEGYPKVIVGESTATDNDDDDDDDESVLPSSARQKAAVAALEIPNNDTDTTNAPAPSSISLADAKALIQAHQVTVEASGASNGDELAPYVESPTSSAAPSPSGATTPVPRIYALDCEMVKTSAGTELARITLVRVVNYNGGGEAETCVVWDEIVQPRHRVFDYVTAFSGMTEAIMRDVTTQIEQVQASLLLTIAPHDMVIGHSLENDLRAARYIHRRVIDTALLFRANHGRFKYSLRHLAARLLHIQIQRSDQPHCSEEDAVTALQLAVRRAVDGPAFGVWDKTQLNRLSALAQGGTTVCVGPSDWLQTHVTSQPNAIHALSCNSVDHPNRKAIGAWLTGPNPKRRARLVWGNMNLSNTPKDIDSLESLVKALLSDKALSSKTVLIVAVQCGYEQAAHMTKQRRVRQSPKATMGWSPVEEEEWSKAVEACRLGPTFWISPKNSEQTATLE
jgi:DNA polymerase III epsilon subunit-like protein